MGKSLAFRGVRGLLWNALVEPGLAHVDVAAKGKWKRLLLGIGAVSLIRRVRLGVMPSLAGRSRPPPTRYPSTHRYTQPSSVLDSPSRLSLSLFLSFPLAGPHRVPLARNPRVCWLFLLVMTQCASTTTKAAHAHHRSTGAIHARPARNTAWTCALLGPINYSFGLHSWNENVDNACSHITLFRWLSCCCCSEKQSMYVE